MAMIGVSIVFTAIDALSQGVAVIGSSLARLGGAFGGIGRIMMGFAAGPAAGVGAIVGEIISVVQESISTFADYETALTKVVAATGETGEAATVLRDQFAALAEVMGVQFAIGATEALAALEALVKAGYSGSEAMAALTGALRLATIEGISAGESANYVVGSLNMFGMAAEDAAYMVDILTNASMAGIDTVSEYAIGLSYCGKTFNMYGLSAEEAAAALVMVNNQGITAEKSGRYLDAMMRDLTSTTADLKFELYDAAGNMIPLTEIVGNLEQNMIGLSTEEKVAYLEAIGLTSQSSRAVAALTSMSEAGELGSERLADLVVRMGETGTAAAIADAQLSTTAAAMNRLGAAVETVKTKMGEALAPAVHVLSEGLIWFMDSVLVPLGGFVVTVFTPIWDALAVLFNTLAGYLAPVVEGFVQWWNTLTEGAPIMEMVGTLIGQILAFPIQMLTDIVHYLATAWAEDWGGIRSFTEDVIATAIIPIIDILKAGLGFIYETILPTMQIIWTTVWGVMQETLTVFWDIAAPIFDIMKGVLDAIVGAAEFLGGIIASVFGVTVPEEMSEAESAAESHGEDIEDAFRDVGSEAGSAAGGVYGLQSAIDALHDKHIHIYTHYHSIYHSGPEAYPPLLYERLEDKHYDLVFGYRTEGVPLAGVGVGGMEININAPLVYIKGSADERTADRATRLVMERLRRVTR